MNVIKMLKTLSLFLIIGLPAQAATQIKETWDVKWAGQKCTLVLSCDKAEQAGSVKVKSGCGKTLRRVKSFVYTDANHSQMILFTRKNARGAPVGSFDTAGKKSFRGMIGDGTSAKMFRTGISTVTVSAGLVTLSFRSLSSNICYEGDKKWQYDTATSFGVMRSASQPQVALQGRKLRQI